MARFIYNPFSMLAVTLAQARLQGRGKSRVSLPTPEKKCVNCKTPHTTGKPFCSAECCREYKENGNQPRASLQPFELIPGERYVFMANTDEYGGNYSGIFEGPDADGRCKFRDCVMLDPEQPDVCIEAAAIIDIERWPTKLEFEPEWSHEFEAMQRTKEVRIAG